VYYHVLMFEPMDPDNPGSRGTSFQFLNLTEGDLRTRVVEAWETGRGITWSGSTARPTRARYIKVFETDEPTPSDLEGRRHLAGRQPKVVKSH
jgi:hypothetical protein